MVSEGSQHAGPRVRQGGNQAMEDELAAMREAMASLRGRLAGTPPQGQGPQGKGKGHGRGDGGAPPSLHPCQRHQNRRDRPRSETCRCRLLPHRGRGAMQPRQTIQPDKSASLVKPHWPGQNGHTRSPPFLLQHGEFQGVTQTWNHHPADQGRRNSPEGPRSTGTCTSGRDRSPGRTGGSQGGGGSEPSAQQDPQHCGSSQNGRPSARCMGRHLMPLRPPDAGPRRCEKGLVRGCSRSSKLAPNNGCDGGWICEQSKNRLSIS